MQTNRAANAARKWTEEMPCKSDAYDRDADVYETYSYSLNSKVLMKPTETGSQGVTSDESSYGAQSRSKWSNLSSGPPSFATPKGEDHRHDPRQVSQEKPGDYEEKYSRLTNKERLDYHRAAVKIQSVFRGYRARKQFWKLREQARYSRDTNQNKLVAKTQHMNLHTRQKAARSKRRMSERDQVVETPSNADPHLGRLGPLQSVSLSMKEEMLTEKKNHIDETVPLIQEWQDETCNVILLTGGINPDEPENFHLFASSVYVYNVEKNKWFFGGTMPEPRCYHTAAYCNGKVYIVGGFDPFSVKQGEMLPTNTIYQLNVRGKRWRPRVDMHQCRAYHGICILNNMILVIGGKDEEGRVLSTVEKYDTVQDKWVLLKPLPKPLMGIAVTTLDGIVYVIGGISSDSEMNSTVYAFDMDQAAWSIKGKFPEPIAFASAVTVCREIWVFGGVRQKLSASGHLTSCDAVYVQRNSPEFTWELSKERLSMPKHCMALTKSMGRKIFILGGMSSEAMEAIAENDLFDRESMQLIYGAPLPCPNTGCAAVSLPPDQTSRLLHKWAGGQVPEDVKDTAATKIQARFRGHLSRAAMESHSTPMYNSTLEALTGNNAYQKQVHSTHTVKITTAARIDDDFRKFKTVSIPEWPPAINPCSSRSEVNIAFGTHPPGYTIGETSETERRSQVKRYICLRLDCDPNLGRVDSMEDCFKRTRQSLGLRRMEACPYSHLEVKGGAAIKDDSIPVVLLIGGLNIQQPTNYAFGRSVVKYHPLKNRWQYVGVIPEPRNHHATAYMDGTVYVAGGLDPDNRKTGEMVASATLFSMKVQVGEWVRKASMLCPRAFHALVALQGKLYAIGGRDSNGRVVASIECYDPKTDSWVLKRPMSSARLGVACTVYENKIWCLGGIGSGNGDTSGTSSHFKILSVVTSYDPTTDAWELRPPLRCPRAYASCVTINKKIWLCGGSCRIKDHETLVSMGSVDSYDSEDSEWQRRTIISNPRHCSAIAAVEDCFYVFGGMSSQEWSSVVHNEMVITTDHSVHNCEDLVYPLTGAAAVTIPPRSPSLRSASLSFLLHYKLAR